MMTKLEYEVRFTTPVHIGNANQNSQWRTPPFKHLIRQWWRIVWVAGKNLTDVDILGEMKEAERNLFGSPANGEKDIQRSKLRLRLSNWSKGNSRINFNYKQEYLKFGVSENNWIQTNANNPTFLRIAVPNEELDDVVTSLKLINAFGTLGGRSRNGWGSVVLLPRNQSPQLGSLRLEQFTRQWKDSLRVGWPHTFGNDRRGPLVWQTTRTYKNWWQVVDTLSTLRREINKSSQNRVLLSYPAGKKKSFKGYGYQRLPNALRFKVRMVDSNANQLIGTVFFIPSIKFKNDNLVNEKSYREIRTVWKGVFGKLDADNKFKRSQI